jgi:Protein of unknown function (DUF2785)
MTDWAAVIEQDFRLPAGLSQADAVIELSAALRSPDPVLRDEQAFSVLAGLVPELDSAQRRRLGDEFAHRLADPEIQARTFAALILAAVVEAGEYEPGWLAAFEAWYPAETDLRGYDPVLGWLHAVAHGADLLGTFGRCPRVAPARLLDLAAARLLAPTDYVFADQEDDRVAHAVALTLTRAELTRGEAVGWLTAIAGSLGAGQPGPVPAPASNTMRTLRVLYLLADRGVRLDWSAQAEPVALPHREAVKERLAEVLALAAPYAG